VNSQGSEVESLNVQAELVDARKLTVSTLWAYLLKFEIEAAKLQIRCHNRYSKNQYILRLETIVRTQIPCPGIVHRSVRDYGDTASLRYNGSKTQNDIPKLLPDYIRSPKY
jgi:hypothetical protein